jgi:hypothetical protein
VKFACAGVIAASVSTLRNTKYRFEESMLASAFNTLRV